jgi:hypothetical protein
LTADRRTANHTGDTLCAQSIATSTAMLRHCGVRLRAESRSTRRSAGTPTKGKAIPVEICRNSQSARRAAGRASPVPTMVCCMRMRRVRRPTANSLSNAAPIRSHGFAYVMRMRIRRIDTHSAAPSFGTHQNDLRMVLHRQRDRLRPQVRRGAHNFPETSSDQSDSFEEHTMQTAHSAVHCSL